MEGRRAGHPGRHAGKKTAVMVIHQDEQLSPAQIERRRALVTNDLTRQVWFELHGYLQRHGFAPSYRELAALCYCSTTAITNHLGRLERAGVLETGLGRPRAIKLLVPYPEPEHSPQHDIRAGRLGSFV